MYFHYCLTAAGTIFLISLVVFLFMRKNNQANRVNKAKLIVCAVLSMICAAAVPPAARVIAEEFDLSIYVSIIVSIIALIAAAIIVFLIIKPSINKLSSEPAGEQEISPVPESPAEQAAEAYDQAAPASESTEPVYIAVPDRAGTPEDIINADAEKEGSEDIIPEDDFHDYIIEPEPFPVHAGYNYSQEDIMRLLDEAFEMKSRRDLDGAISNYEAALVMNPDEELKYLIILDLCSLYKKTGRQDSINRILEATRCELLNSEKKADILRNL